METSPLIANAQRAYRLLITAASKLQSPLLLALRLYIGWQFFLSGKGKLTDLAKPTEFFRDLGIPWPGFNAVLAGSTECFGGLLLIAGLASRLVSLPLAFTMVVAYLTADREALLSIFSDPDKILASAPLPFLTTALIVLAFGPGVFSLDWLIAKKFGTKSHRGTEPGKSSRMPPFFSCPYSTRNARPFSPAGQSASVRGSGGQGDGGSGQG